jgi:SAM-dependent methyltransferase
MKARYDGVADWYEHEFMGRPGAGSDTRDVAAQLLGDGPGRLLDVGCGTGVYAEALAERGWTVTGVDVSEDMLRFARSRGLDVVHADARSLPFDPDTFDAVVSLWTHTDVDDFAAVVREIARVVRRGGRFVYIGAHPCFVGPHSRFLFAEGIPALHLGYANAGRYDAEAPGVVQGDGLRAKVGAVHLPLGSFMGAFLDAGFRLESFVEPVLRDYPYMLGLRWRR